MKSNIPSWLLNQLPYDHSWINVGKEMHVMKKGEGKPIVMVHGNPMWGYLYKKVLDGLDNSNRYIVPDLIGFGFSDKIKLHEHSLEAHSNWMAEFFLTIKEELHGHAQKFRGKVFLSRGFHFTTPTHRIAPSR